MKPLTFDLDLHGVQQTTSEIFPSLGDQTEESQGGIDVLCSKSSDSVITSQTIFMCLDHELFHFRIIGNTQFECRGLNAYSQVLQFTPIRPQYTNIELLFIPLSLSLLHI